MQLSVAKVLVSKKIAPLAKQLQAAVAPLERPAAQVVTAPAGVTVVAVVWVHQQQQLAQAAMARFLAAAEAAVVPA
mgnify:CR=1 FL=1